MLFVVAVVVFGYPHLNKSKKAGSIVKKPIKIFRYSWMIQLSCASSFAPYHLFSLSTSISSTALVRFVCFVVVFVIVVIVAVAVVDCLFQILLYRWIHSDQMHEYVCIFICSSEWVRMCVCVILSNEKKEEET